MFWALCGPFCCARIILPNLMNMDYDIENGLCRFVQEAAKHGNQAH